MRAKQVLEVLRQGYSMLATSRRDTFLSLTLGLSFWQKGVRPHQVWLDACTLILCWEQGAHLLVLFGDLLVPTHTTVTDADCDL